MAYKNARQATPPRKYRAAFGIMSIEGIRYKDGKLTILNQLLLPHEIVYEPLNTVEEAWKAIREMKVTL